MLFKNIQRLSIEELSKFVPHILIDSPIGVSKNYKFYSTKALLEIAEDFGYFPCAGWGNPKSQYGFHQIFLRKENDIKTADELIQSGINEIIQLSFINSFNRSSAFQAEFGSFVPKCANGLLLPKDEILSFRQIHKGIGFKEIKKTIKGFFKQENKIQDFLDKFKKKYLTKKESNSFLNKSLEYRFDSKILKENSSCLKDQLLTPIRKDDDPNNLWTLYNNTEERIVNGLLCFENGKKVKKIKENSIAKIELERFLANLANKYK